MTTECTAQPQSEPPSEIHRCDKCRERTRHIVVLVARDHTQDIMPKAGKPLLPAASPTGRLVKHWLTRPPM